MSDIRQKTIQAYLRNGGNISATAQELGRDPSTVRWHVRKAGIEKPVAAGEVEHESPRAIPPKRGGRVFILTCAQNNTTVHEAFWENLLALRDHRSAELHVSCIRYNHHAFSNEEELWYDPKIAPFVSDGAIEIAPELVWNGQVNILPTAVNPLSGFDTFNGAKSGVFPHTKIAMSSIANAMSEPTKFTYTTGTVTQRNYIQRKAGQKASFHHAYGALLVEVDASGQWFARQINAREDGSFYDLDMLVSGGQVTRGHAVSAIIWGDAHVAKLDPVVRATSWGEGGILDQLKPEVQVFHDLLDFRARNHHDVRDCHRNFRKHLEGTDDVAAEVRRTAEFLGEAHREGVQSVVIPSNHDDALTRWLREADYREDPKNALFFLRAQTAVYEAIAEGDEDFHVLRWALTDGTSPGLWYDWQDDAKFLHIDDSYVVHGIELGNHGHLGINGSRGTPRQFARSGRKAVTGHTHSAGIIDGVYTVGTSSLLDCGYNKGPSSWSHTHCVVYPNGKRALITLRDGRWRGA